MKYDQSVNPPAPVLTIGVSSPKRRSSVVRDQAVLDTGAGITVIPSSVIEALGVAPERFVILIGYDGAETDYPTYLVNLEMLGHQFRNLRVVAIHPSPRLWHHDHQGSYWNRPLHE